MRSCLAAALLMSLAPAAPSQTKDEIPIKKLALAPAAEPSPALKHRLLPPLWEQKTGNAALLYQLAHSPEWFGSLRRHPDWDAMHDFVDLPLSKFPRAKAASFFMGSMMREIDLAARRTYCEWEMTERIREDGFGLLIPDVQTFRTYGTLLSLRTRTLLVDRKYDEAVSSLQTHVALARHVGDAPILINTLVANAIANRALEDLEELTQLQDAPNLYWALADLPRPLIPLRKAMEGERLMIDVVFPGVRQALKNPEHPPLSAEQIHEGWKQLNFLGPESNVNKLALAYLASRSYPKARQYLLDNGFRAEHIDAMTVTQVAAMHAVVEYDRVYDEAAKWYNQPPWVARGGLRKAFRTLVGERRASLDMTVLPALIIPAVEKVHEAQVRLERRIALLQTIEAIRAYAAANDGKLPETLADVKNTPVPLDPETGAPFQYTLDDGKATLVGPAPPGMPANVLTVRRYELTVAASRGTK